jgi:hypothetical protein
MKCRTIIFFIILVLLCGCSHFDRKSTGIHSTASLPKDVQSALYVVSSLKQTNASLKSYKGIGRIKIGNAFRVMQSTRTVFAGYHAQKLRFEILGLSGQPITSVAHDGTWFYMAEFTANRFYRKQFPNADLDRLINIPIKIDTINSLLSGQIPMIDHASARLEIEPSGNGYILHLQKGWWFRQHEKIYLSTDMKTAWKYEMFEGKDELLYRLKIASFKNFQGYQIPQQIEFTGKDGTKMWLEIDRYWANADVDMSLFVLKPPPK